MPVAVGVNKQGDESIYIPFFSLLNQSLFPFVYSLYFVCFKLDIPEALAGSQLLFLWNSDGKLGWVDGMTEEKLSGADRVCII